MMGNARRIRLVTSLWVVLQATMGVVNVNVNVEGWTPPSPSWWNRKGMGSGSGLGIGIGSRSVQRRHTSMSKSPLSMARSPSSPAPAPSSKRRPKANNTDDMKQKKTNRYPKNYQSHQDRRSLKNPAEENSNNSNSNSNNAASNSAATTASIPKNNSNTHPFRMSVFKVEQRIQDIHKKDLKGEILTQAYCDSVLGLCVAYDEWESVLDVLDVMKRQGYTQELSSYRACLQASFEAGNGASAREILQAMETANVEPEPWDIGLTIAAMCRQNLVEPGWWRKALGLLKATASEGKVVKNTQTVIPVKAYDVVLECMLEERQWKEAVRLLRMMEASGSTQAGFHPIPEVSTYRQVIECCVAANQAEQAAQILYSMKSKNIKPSTYACELVISALSKKMQWRRALQLLELMEELEIPKTVVTYNTVIGACARSREVGMAKGLLSRMRKEGIRPDVVSFNSVIGACASTARWRDALNLLDQCYREPGVTPNIYIYTNAMRACAKGGNTNRALSLLQVVKDKGLPLDTYCYTAVIDACAKAKMWEKALALFYEMQEQGIHPSEVTYSVTISACGNGGQWQKALDLLNLMKSKNMSTNVITYNAALTALSKAARQNARNTARSNEENHGIAGVVTKGDGLWSKSLQILQDMKAEGIEPDGFCYSSAISCCGAEGRWEEALELIDTMKRGGPRTRPNRIAYTAAISACGRAGEASHALKLFQSMRDEGLSADRVAYNTLFSAMRVAGEPEKAFELWGEICGTRTTSTRAIATAKHIASPDIITVTDCVATLSRAERMDQVDQVFLEAVKLGILMRGNKLDLQWETDLSGMSLPVARGAVRYILRQCLSEELDNVQDITFITGVGRAQKERKDHGTSLREYVQEVLQTDFDPSIESIIPERAKGTVEIPKDALKDWIQTQNVIRTN